LDRDMDMERCLFIYGQTKHDVLVSEKVTP